MQVVRTWPVGQAVKTLASHAGNMGSIPVRVTKNKKDTRRVSFFAFVAVSLTDTAFAKQMHGFASPPKPSGSLLTSGKARDIARRATSRTVCIANAWVRILRVKPSRARSGSLRAKIFAAGEIPVRLAPRTNPERSELGLCAFWTTHPPQAVGML